MEGIAKAKAAGVYKVRPPSIEPSRVRELKAQGMRPVDIAKAKAAAVYKGRPPSIEPSRVRELKAQGMRPVDIAKALQIGRASVYRVLGQKADH